MSSGNPFPTCVAIAMVSLVAGGPVFGGGLDVIQINWGEGQSWTSSEATIGEVVSLPDGTVVLRGGQSASEWAATWDISVNEDPAVSINVNFTSNKPYTADFEFIASVPSSDLYSAPTHAFGSSSLTLMDNVTYHDGATVAAVGGDSAYTALLNGTVIATLMPAPFSLSAAPYLTNSAGPFQFNDPNGQAVQVGDVLKIRHKFSLSPYDTVQFVSTAVVLPEPATVALIVLGALALVTRRR